MDSNVAMDFFAVRKKEMTHRGYLVVKEFSNACSFSTLFFKKLEALLSYHQETLESLFAFLYDSFPGEEALQAE